MNDLLSRPVRASLDSEVWLEVAAVNYSCLGYVLPQEIGSKIFNWESDCFPKCYEVLDLPSL